jgi:1-acyl-sn-glycerol-3-phosphate acyltransferase
MGLSYAIGKAGFQLLFRLYFRGSVHHAENIPRDGSFLIAANHASFLDPPMVGQAIPRQICYLARKTLFRNPVIGALLRSWKSIPLDRDEGDIGAIRAILNALKKGEAVMLFPEGTRTNDGKLQAAKPGIGFLVAKANVPVVPARIWGSFEAMGRGKSWPRPVKLHVTFGKPLRFDTSNVKREEREIAYRRISDDIMAAIAQLEPKD